MNTHAHVENHDEDEGKGRRAVVAGYRWWNRYGWLRWLFARGGENAGLLTAAMVVAGTGAWTVTDTIDSRARGKFLRPVVTAEELSPGTKAFVLEGVDNAGRRADFDLIVANSDFTWERGSTERLARADKPLTRAELDSLVLDELVRARLKLAKQLIAVGTASQEGDPQQEIVRAGKRAEQAAQWIEPLAEKDTPIWTLNLGQYKDPCEACNTEATNWQRPFLVVAVRRAAWGVDIGEALSDALSSASNLPSTDRYSAFAMSRHR
ncbi:MAG: hypothetical protein JNM89_00230 [Hyphomicrobiaceae bacterium]|nr:hypothetical protein [Hyphomicrobiaceae bacterium]